MKINQRTGALISGISLLIMTIAAFFSYGYAHTQLFSDPINLETLRALRDTPLFIYEIMGWFVIVITDLLVAWGFYLYLKPYHHRYALYSALLRVIYTLFLCVSLFWLSSLFTVIEIKTSSDVEMIALLSQRLDLFFMTWQAGLIIFGFHLILTGIITKVSKVVPQMWFFLLAIAGSGYIVTSSLILFLPEEQALYQVVNAVFMLPMIVGELGFGIWLLFKGNHP